MAFPYVPSFIKDPQAVLDFNWDWSAWLGAGETIIDTSVTPDDGLTVNSSNISGDVVSAWLAGGVVGTTYTVACTITTSAGRTETRRIQISVGLR
ncbi:hypothetical protein [Caballeronia zhejiangensis]|uniref:Uncharacterized protein n=1 Tax=Caballeronia zhejiangensis TaxID=871203 RepID=A0A656Q9L2_9BURK|nr:hypothetical protein [Caballeronia zhejiangensis]KDR25417.1 hypothetical protein BG60_28135 [Caballeronia zhejiangensis]